VKIRPHTLGFMLLAVLLAGCTSVPMNYSQWKKEQEDRRKFEQAGLPYKSPAQLRAEAAEMRRVAEKTTFSPAAK
jgi:starvation-inducible outer membrane lipoprotein